MALVMRTVLVLALFLMSCPAAAQAPTVTAEAISDVFAVIDGGVRQSTRSLHKFGLSAEVPVGQHGRFVLGAEAVTRPGVSEDLIGDLQVVSNIEAPAGVRLAEASYAHDFADGRFGLKLGVWDLNSEFDVIETGGLFLNASNGIGPDFAATGDNGPSIFPIYGLGGRAHAQLSNAVTVRAAVFEGTPGNPDRPKALTLKLGDGEGALIVGETEVKAGESIIKIGAWAYTKRFDALTRLDALGNPLQLRRSRGAYASADVCLSVGDACNVRGFVRVGRADGTVNPVVGHYAAGIRWSGALAQRPDDHVGIALNVAELGGPARDIGRAAGFDMAKREWAFEATYRVQVRDWLALQPVLGYVRNPSATRDLDDALFTALRFEVSQSF
jgi:porin